MKFLVMVRSKESSAPPPPALMGAIGKLGEAAVRAGTLVQTGGLFPSARGTRVSLAGNTFTVTDGPFAETKELIGGYAIVEVPSKDEAIRITREFLQLHRDVLGPGYSGESEIREMMGVTHFTTVAA